MKAANESKMNALFLNKMQVEISGKKYPNDMNFVDTMECIFQTDPLSTFSVDEKLSMLQNKGITEEDFVVSCNIQQFIKTAIEEDDNFLNLPFLEKQSVIYQMATDKILSQKVGESIIKSIVSPVIPATVDDTTKDKIVTPVM